MGLKLGDKVRWTSQAGGTARTKEGEIVEVVPVGKCPGQGIREPGGPRDHESYVIRGHPVRNDGTLGAPRKYWPRVKYLQIVHTNERLAETQVVDVLTPTSRTQIASEDAKKPTTSDTVTINPGEDVTLTDHGFHNEPIPLDQLKAETEKWDPEPEPEPKDERKQAIIDAITRRRLREEGDDDQEEELDDGSNGERW